MAGNGYDGVSYGGVPYERGNSFVIPYTVAEGTALKYNEYLIRNVAIADAWSSTDKTANITLSNVDKTAMVSASAFAAVRSTTKRSAGPYYAEFVISSVASDMRVGLKSSSSSINDTTSAFSLSQNGDLRNTSNTLMGNIGSLQAGDVVGVAWNANYVWFRRNSGYWNNNATANPSLAANGFACSFGSATFGLWFTSSTINISTVVRTTAAALTFNPPGGFQSWMAERLSVVDGWDVNDKADDIVLPITGQHRLATTIDTAILGARSSTRVVNGTPGKHFLQWVIGNYPPVNVGIQSYSAGLTNSADAVHVYLTNGDIKVPPSGTVVGNIGGSVGIDDVITAAWDTGTEEVWFRKNLGNWNNNAAANPDTGVGGISVAGAANIAHAAWFATMGAIGDIVTLRTRKDDFSTTVTPERKNLVLHSQDFANAYWTGANVTRLDNVIVAPDSTTTASSFEATGATSLAHNTYNVGNKITNIPAGPCTLSIHGKYAGGQWLQLGSSTGVSSFANFDLANGVVGAKSADATSSIINVGNGWYRCTLTFTKTNNADMYAYINMLGSDVATFGAASIITGYILYIWGLQVEPHNKATPYVATTTAAVTVPAVVTPLEMPTDYLSWMGEAIGPPADRPVASSLSVAAPAISSSTLTQVHTLPAPLPINLTVPSYGVGTIVQRHELASPIATVSGLPVFGAILFKQTVPLATSALIVAPYVLGVPATMTQAHKIVAQPFAPLWSYTSPAIAQDHALTAANLSVAPVLDESTIKLVVPMFADDLTTSAPVIAAANATVRLALAASGFIGTGFGYANAVIHEINLLSAANLATGPPVLPATPWGVQRTFTAAAFATTAPTIGATALTQRHPCIATSHATSAPSFGAATFNQVYTLTAALAASSPTIGGSSINQKQVLPAPLSIFDVNYPVIPIGFLGQAGVFTPLPAAAGIPAIGVSTLAQRQVLTAAYAPKSPVIGSAIYSKNILPAPLAITAPSIGTSALTIALDVDALVAPVPVIGTPALKKVLTAANLTAPLPVIAAGVLKQAHALGADPLVVAPDIPTAYMSQAGVFSLVPLNVSEPVIGTAAFTQRQVLAAVALSVAVPSIGQGVYGRVIPAIALTVTSPSVGTGPVLRKVLTPSGFASPAPMLDDTAWLAVSITAADLAPTPTIGVGTIKQRHVFVGSSIAVVSPLTSPVVLGQAGVLQFMPLVAGQPTFTIPLLKQRHVLAATGCDGRAADDRCRHDRAGASVRHRGRAAIDCRACARARHQGDRADAPAHRGPRARRARARGRGAASGESTRHRSRLLGHHSDCQRRNLWPGSPCHRTGRDGSIAFRGYVCPWQGGPG